jgi:hypothetical protein
VAPSVNPGAPVTVRLTVVAAVTAPDVPVSVTVALPFAAVDAAANVTVLPVAVAAPNVAVMPAGSPLAMIVGVPVKPFWAVTAMAVAADAPAATLTLAGVAAMVKAGAGLTVRLTGIDADIAPEVAVTVTFCVTAAALAAAVKVTVLVVDIVAGLNEAVTPAGSAAAARVTVPLKPFFLTSVIVLVAVDPDTTLVAGFVTVNEKVAAGDTVNEI